MKDRPVPTEEQSAVLRRIESCPEEYVIGIDEVGYGACAGPLVVAGVLAHKGWDHPFARDSKALTVRQRSVGCEQLINLSRSDSGIVLAVVMSVEAEDVDHLGVFRANQFLTQRVASLLYPLKKSVVVVDGNPVRLEDVPFDKTYAMAGADSQVPATGAASVIAKVTRDTMMVQYHQVLPAYDWTSNKGYLTAKHEEQLKAHGTSYIHRLSYERIRKYMVDSTQWPRPRQKQEMDVWTYYPLR